jgi:hypothetical protein
MKHIVLYEIRMFLNTWTGCLLLRLDYGYPRCPAPGVRRQGEVGGGGEERPGTTQGEREREREREGNSLELAHVLMSFGILVYVSLSRLL